jgi:hypothetical protein
LGASWSSRAAFGRAAQAPGHRSALPLSPDHVVRGRRGRPAVRTRSRGACHLGGPDAAQQRHRDPVAHGGPTATDRREAGAAALRSSRGEGLHVRPASACWVPALDPRTTVDDLQVGRSTRPPLARVRPRTPARRPCPTPPATVLTQPLYEWPTRTTGPSSWSMTASRYETSLTTPRSGTAFGDASSWRSVFEHLDTTVNEDDCRFRHEAFFH